MILNASYLGVNLRNAFIVIVIYPGKWVGRAFRKDFDFPTWIFLLGVFYWGAECRDAAVTLAAVTLQ